MQNNVTTIKQGELTKNINELSDKIGDEWYNAIAATGVSLAALGLAPVLLYNAFANNDNNIDAIEGYIEQGNATIVEQTLTTEEVEQLKSKARAEYAYGITIAANSEATIIVPKSNKEIKSLFNQARTEAKSKKLEAAHTNANNHEDTATNTVTVSLALLVIGAACARIGYNHNKTRKDLNGQRSDFKNQLEELNID